MFFRCLLLVLVCLQDFTLAQDNNGPGQCCFSFQTHRIPVRLITAYQETDRQCTKPGVIFTLMSGNMTCANPEVEWVQNHMKTIDQRLIQNQPSANGPKTCCFSYQTHKIPVRVITEYQETERQCTKPGVIFFLKSGREVCADPNVEWVKNIMKKLPSA